MSAIPDCRGNFASDSACGKCVRCQANLEKIKRQTGLISVDDVASGLAEDIERALCIGPMNLFDQRMNIIWQKYFKRDWRHKDNRVNYNTHPPQEDEAW